MIHEIEEFPLRMIGGREAALIDVAFQIDYDRTGDWSVSSVGVQAYDKTTRSFEREWLDKDDALAALILERLYADADDLADIEDKVWTAIEDDGLSSRFDREEHGTYWGAP